jgi:hypothetical protein
MSKSQAGHELSSLELLLGDLSGLVVTGLPVLASYFGTAVVIHSCLWNEIGIFSLLLAPIILVTLFIFLLFVFRLTLPRLKPGLYPTGLNRGFMSWMLHVYLSRAVEICGFKNFLFAFGTTRFLVFRALGAKVPFRMIGSLGLSIVDYPLIEIGKLVTLTEGVQLSCHTVVKGKLWLKKLKIEDGAYIGMHCLIGLGSVVGAGSMIGPYNKIAGDRLPIATVLAPFEWEHGNPEKKHNR